MINKYEKISTIISTIIVFIFCSIAIIFLTICNNKPKKIPKTNNEICISTKMFKKSITRKNVTKIKNKPKKKNIKKKKIKQNPLAQKIKSKSIVKEKNKNLISENPKNDDKNNNFSKNMVTKNETIQNIQDEKETINNIINYITELIENNKYYHPIAIRKNIEGTVTIVILLSENGIIENYEIKGKVNKYLDKSIKKTMKKILNSKINIPNINEKYKISVPVTFNIKNK